MLPAEQSSCFKSCSDFKRLEVAAVSAEGVTLKQSNANVFPNMLGITVDFRDYKCRPWETSLLHRTLFNTVNAPTNSRMGRKCCSECISKVDLMAPTCCVWLQGWHRFKERSPWPNAAPPVFRFSIVHAISEAAAPPKDLCNLRMNREITRKIARRVRVRSLSVWEWARKTARLFEEDKMDFGNITEPQRRPFSLRVHMERCHIFNRSVEL